MRCSLGPAWSEGRLATVDGDDLAGDESGLMRGEELDDVGDLVDVAEATHGDAGGHCGACVRPAGEVVQTSGGHGAGGDRIDPDAFGCDFEGADRVNPFTACLLATYRPAPRPRAQPNVEERLTILPCPCSIMTRSSCFRENSKPRDVGVENGVVRLRGWVVRGPALPV